MKVFFFVLAAVFVTISSYSSYAQESDLVGICKQKNTSDRCQFRNNSLSKVVGISWLLPGREFDYVEETSVSLRPGQSVEISNKRGRDNCLFTQDTSIYITWDNETTKAYHGILRFDSLGQCFMSIPQRQLHP